jgi:hypothetical protein
VHSLGVQRSALVLFSMRTLQESETLERYYTTIRLAVYSANARSCPFNLGRFRTVPVIRFGACQATPPPLNRLHLVFAP